MDALIERMAKAARIIADRICAEVQAAELIGVRLPRNYMVRMRERPVLFLGDSPVSADTVVRETLLKFTMDLKDGLQAEVGAYIIERRMEEEEALGILEGLAGG